MDFRHNHPLSFGRETSEDTYRTISAGIREVSTSTIKSIMEHDPSISTIEAERVASERDPSFDPWNAYKISEGLISTSLDANAIPQVCCVSEIPSRYLDTFIIKIDASDKVSYVTYNDRFREGIIHSGDILLPHAPNDWLRHTISMTDDHTVRYYVGLAGWNNCEAHPLIDFAELDPLFEVRYFDGDEKKRKLLNTHLHESESYTAMICCVISYNEETSMWNLNVVREFSMGFVGEIQPIIDVCKRI